jgi:hypothetical protein
MAVLGSLLPEFILLQRTTLMNSEQNKLRTNYPESANNACGQSRVLRAVFKIDQERRRRRRRKRKGNLLSRAQ